MRLQDCCRHRAVAQRLAHFLKSSTVRPLPDRRYFNAFRCEGQRGTVLVNDVPIHLAQSSTPNLTTGPELVDILEFPDWIDTSKSLVYLAKRRHGLGLRLEIWRCARWYHLFIPITKSNCNDPIIVELLRLTGWSM